MRPRHEVSLERAESHTHVTWVPVGPPPLEDEHICFPEVTRGFPRVPTNTGLISPDVHTSLRLPCSATPSASDQALAPPARPQEPAGPTSAPQLGRAPGGLGVQGTWPGSQPHTGFPEAGRQLSLGPPSTLSPTCPQIIPGQGQMCMTPWGWAPEFPLSTRMEKGPWGLRHEAGTWSPLPGPSKVTSGLCCSSHQCVSPL